jgi:hypothetical protein
MTTSVPCIAKQSSSGATDPAGEALHHPLDYTLHACLYTATTSSKAIVTVPMCREAPSNFGVKLPRPGFGPAAELPASSPA